MAAAPTYSAEVAPARAARRSFWVLLAGGAAGVASRTLTAPIDRARIICAANGVTVRTAVQTIQRQGARPLRVERCKPALAMSEYRPGNLQWYECRTSSGARHRRCAVRRHCVRVSRKRHELRQSMSRAWIKVWDCISHLAVLEVWQRPRNNTNSEVYVGLHWRGYRTGE